jgi:hypothetical protein
MSARRAIQTLSLEDKRSSRERRDQVAAALNTELALTLNNFDISTLN